MLGKRRVLVILFFLDVGGALGDLDSRNFRQSRPTANQRPAASDSDPPLTPREERTEEEENANLAALDADLGPQQAHALPAPQETKSKTYSSSPSVDIQATLQDLTEATSIKGAFNEFLAQVHDDTAKLQDAVKKKDLEIESLQAKVSNLELREKEAEAAKVAVSQGLSKKVEAHTKKREKTIKALQTQNEALTNTNLKLVGTNDDLAKDLKAVKKRNQRLSQKLQDMVKTFTKQQHAVETMITENNQRMAKEVQEEASSNSK